MQKPIKGNWHIMPISDKVDLRQQALLKIKKDFIIIKRSY